MNRFSLLCLPLIASLLFSEQTARADQNRPPRLDMALLQQSDKILDFCKRKNWKNVGVLHFKLQKGDRPASFSAGPICHDITTRLENALIMVQASDENKALGIIRDAVGTANRKNVGAYRSNPTAFQRLFAQQYELAWGNKSVKADAFLTGTIINAGNDRSRTTILIQAFDSRGVGAKGIQAHKVTEFEVMTDRNLLADMAYNFALNRSRAALVRSRSLDQAASMMTLAWENGQTPTGSLAVSDFSPANVAGFQFEIHYDGVRQNLIAIAGQQPGSQAVTYQVGPANVGSKIALHLNRIDDDPVVKGALILVNGISTFQQQRGPLLELQKWLYRPGLKDPQIYEGFYMGEKGTDLLPFKVLTQEESEIKAPELGSDAGFISVHIFVSGIGRQIEKDETDLVVSTRGLVASRSLALKDLQKQLHKKNHVRVRKVAGSARTRSLTGGLIVNEIEAVPSPEIHIADKLPNPELIGSLTVRYWTGRTTPP
jgi:hypothetical protein